jgi:hypothetical protein
MFEADALEIRARKRRYSASAGDVEPQQPFFRAHLYGGTIPHSRRSPNSGGEIPTATTRLNRPVRPGEKTVDIRSRLRSLILSAWVLVAADRLAMRIVAARHDREIVPARPPRPQQQL